MDRPLEELFENKRNLTTAETTLRSLPSERGVLLFADSNSRPIQLLLTADIRRTVQSKWAQPPTSEPARKVNLRSVAVYVFYTLAAGEYHSQWLYNRLVHLLFPEQTEELLLPQPHCVCLNPKEHWAAFSSSSRPFQEKEAFYWGPFPTRREADFFARTFNDLFSLCRNRSLALGGSGKKCSYFQMGSCPAFCLDSSKQPCYQKALEQAVRAAQSPPALLAAPLSEQMKTLAARQQFEQAQAVKNHLDALAKLQTAPYRWTSELDKLKILHIAEGRRIRFEPKRTKQPVYQAFLITSRMAEKLINFTLPSVEKLLEALFSPPRRCLLPADNLSEHLALTSLYLYKSHPAGLWLNLNTEPCTDCRTLQQKIQECFQNTPQQEQ